MENLFEPLALLDWSCLSAVSEATEPVLRTIAMDRKLLRDLLENIQQTPELADLCEHYDLLDKLVLHADPEQRFRVRLHMFLPGYFDRPHNHRWSYSSLVLRGSYRHALFAAPSNDAIVIDVANLRVLALREEHENMFYTLHHTAIHSVTAQPFTVSIIVRGPAEKDRFFVGDRVTNESWWQHGALTESAEVSRAKRMSLLQIEKSITKLKEIDVL